MQAVVTCGTPGTMQSKTMDTSWFIDVVNAYAHFQCHLLIFISYLRFIITYLCHGLFMSMIVPIIYLGSESTTHRQSVVTHPPRQNSHHFADDIFRCNFVNEKFCILIDIALKFVP